MGVIITRPRQRDGWNCHRAALVDFIKHPTKILRIGILFQGAKTIVVSTYRKMTTKGRSDRGPHQHFMVYDILGKIPCNLMNLQKRVDDTKFHDWLVRYAKFEFELCVFPKAVGSFVILVADGLKRTVAL